MQEIDNLYTICTDYGNTYIKKTRNSRYSLCHVNLKPLLTIVTTATIANPNIPILKNEKLYCDKRR